MKKPLKMITSIVALMLIITMVAMPTVANAASYNYNSSKSKGFNFSSMLQMATQRYQAVNIYKNYLNEMNKFTEGLDKNMSVDDSKIKIIDKANELQKKYNNDSNSSSISNVTNKIINSTINSNASSTTDLLGSVSGVLKKLLGNTGLSIQSLTPDVKIDDMVATTAGERCGADYKVKLVGKKIKEIPLKIQRNFFHKEFINF